MRWYTHASFGALLSLLILGKNELVLIAAFFAMLPDIDHPRSKWRRLEVFSLAATFLFRHRGMLHTLWAAGAVFALALLVDQWWALAVLLGYVSHLILDALTPAGVCPLNPLPWKAKGSIRTGSLPEKGLLLIMLAALAYLLF